MLFYHKKSRHNLYEQLDYLGLNPYERRHFCFGGAGSGGTDAGGGFGDGPGGDPGGEAESGYDIGFSTAAQETAAAQADAAAADAASGSSVDYGPLADFLDPFVQGVLTGQLDHLGNIIEPEIRSPKLRKRRLLPKPPKMYTSPLLQDPVRMLPKMDSLVDRGTATELGQNYLEMLTQAGLEAKAEGKEKLAEDIQEELDRGLLADYYQNYDLLNALEEVGFKTFGTGYRGPFESRTPKSITREIYGYDPNYGGTNWGQNIAFFRQFAEKNPNLTTAEAIAQYNATANTPEEKLSIEDVQSMGFDLNAAVGPQVAFANAESERGFGQALGLLAKGIAFGPGAAISGLMLSGKTGEDSVLGILTEELDKQTGIPSAVEGFYDQFTTDLGKATDAVVDAVQENIVDPVTGFFSPEPDAPEQAGISNFGRAEEAFFDPVDIGNPYAGLSTPEFEAQMAFEESQRGLQAEAEAAPGTVAADQMAEALENAAYYDSLMNPAAISPPEPGSSFEGLGLKETQDYVAPEGVKLVRKRRAQIAPPPPTVSEQVSPTRTGNFFPGSFDRRTATPRTRAQTLVDIYGFSEEDANRMLGIA